MTLEHKIKIWGAREHNLKSVNVQIPKDSLVILTGPSGCGKSSLALDTLYAEGKRRYVESLSPYARQFLGVNRKPDVDKIEGLCPAIAIEQKTVGHNPRSTVGTTTEIYDYLRLMFARLGTPHCFNCQGALRQETAQSIAELVIKQYEGQTVSLAARLVWQKKGEFKGLIQDYFTKGYTKFSIDEVLYEITSMEQLKRLNLQKTLRHTIYLVVDTLPIKAEELERIFAAIQKVLMFSRGFCSIITDQTAKINTFSTSRLCMTCQLPFPELEPRLFSFNSPVGACQACNGIGVEYGWAMNFNPENDDAADLFKRPCQRCHGARLCPEALAVKIGEHNIWQICNMSVQEALVVMQAVNFQDQEGQIAARVLGEITSRLGFLVEVGLAYLTLARSAATLSGGESQRTHLATQIGSSLSGVLYVLDEPSIGLHQRDNDRLIVTLKRLRDHGNTVVVVEHDSDTMLAADYIVDMGPGAGINGGNIVAAGTPQEVCANPNSLTGDYLTGRKSIPVPTKRRKPSKWLEMVGATKHNLQSIDVRIPLELFCVVTGVSGSGKSSLIIHTLADALNNYFTKGYAVTGSLKSLEGTENIKSVVFVDQKPIGRSPRSTPATYLGIYNDIRALFAALPESRLRGYEPGTFSFNVADGRCEECNGNGSVKISMQFLEDVVVTCKMCRGQRFNPLVLEITFQGKNIFQVLEMPAAEAVQFFAAFSRIAKRLQLMCDVGLGYIRLGQVSSTLSGGENQRLKLVDELSKRGTQTVYILDEPTTGLHFDDIAKLLGILNNLIARGNSIIVIEHNLDVIKSADYIIDLGPEGGNQGGSIVCAGTPEEVALNQRSYTAKYLAKFLKN